jgi:hypothetical protein
VISEESTSEGLRVLINIGVFLASFAAAGSDIQAQLAMARVS